MIGQAQAGNLSSIWQGEKDFDRHPRAPGYFVPRAADAIDARRATRNGAFGLIIGTLH
jgi:hypothetical protein